MMQNILIIGATSAIAEACARRYAHAGARLFLAGRDHTRLRAIADDLRVRGAAQVESGICDVDDDQAQEAVIAQAFAIMSRVDIVLIAHGTLPDQARCESDVTYALQHFHTNATATIALLTRLAQRLQTQGSGTLAAISSVAGDRGRASNALYGSAKAAVDACLSGLRQRLHRHGVNVLTIKPGFVDTPMTHAFRKGLLWAKPDTIARGIERAIAHRRSVVYSPWFWWPIMQAIRHIPEFVFRRVSL